MSRVYTRRELAGSGRQRTYTGDNLHEVALPLGGIGAGCLHVGWRGNCQDFFLFHVPDFGHSPMTFAAVHTRPAGRQRRPGVTRVLEGPVGVPHIFDQGRYGNGVLDAGHDAMAASALATRQAFRTALQAADGAVQVLGGYGYIRDYLPEMHLRNARGFTSFEALTLV